MTRPDWITPTRSNFVFGVVFVLVFGALVWWRTASAPRDIPVSDLAAFSANLTLAQALDRSAHSGRPVLVYATASWCPPCRGFKANTLSREDVAAAIGASFEAVYLDVDRSPREARSLQVSAMPTIMVLENGEQVDRHVGAMETEEFLRFLESHAGRPQSQGAPAGDAVPGASPAGR